MAKNDRIENAVQLVLGTFVDMNEGAKIANLSPVYFRRHVENLEEERGALKRSIFGKQVIERTVAEEILSLVATAKVEREKKAAKKSAAKEAKKEKSGPTLLDLKYHAKQANLKIGRLNKDELISLLKENDVEVEGFEVAEPAVEGSQE